MARVFFSSAQSALADGLPCSGGVCGGGECVAPPAGCGDGVVDPGEECDEGADNGAAAPCGLHPRRRPVIPVRDRDHFFAPRRRARHHHGQIRCCFLRALLMFTTLFFL